MVDYLQIGLFYLMVYFVVNGLDDLCIDVRLVWHWLTGRRRGGTSRLPSLARMRMAPAQRIAILVPLWREAAVIEAMVETNLRQIEYPNYDFFLGVYPNDPDTLRAAESLSRQHSRVHVAVCARPGPTSKADCLNNVYREIERFESANSMRFPMLMLHDAEDMLHPASLQLVNWYSLRNAMVQVPVLPIATPLRDWTHGVYCDEFAEFFQRDLRVRHAEGGFLPSNGVGTAFTRSSLEKLGEQQGGVLLDEESLTEDYEIGLKLHRMGCHQLLLPLTREYGELLATREYFPRNFRDAVRQRTRWICGQSLQSWERNGWPLQWGLLYWFWRDRKGLLGNFLNVLAFVLLTMSVVAMAAPEVTGLGPWLWIAGSVPGAGMLYLGCTLLALERLAMRMVLVGGVYGWRFACGVPLRMVLSTWLNAFATAGALRTYGVARWRRKRLSWMKTEHAFPSGIPAVGDGGIVPSPFAASAGGGMVGEVAHRTIGQSNADVWYPETRVRAAGQGIESVTAFVHSEVRPLRPLARPVSIRDDEVIVAIPRNLPPWERERLMRRKVARLVFVEEDAPSEGSGAS